MAKLYNLIDSVDIENEIEKAVKSNLNPDIFNKIDESDLKPASNVLDACLLDFKLEPYPWQINALLRLFADYCPVCSNPKYIQRMHKESLPEILSNIQLLDFGVCPKCHGNRYDFVKSGQMGLHYELDACVGQRSGKSTLTAMASNRVYQLFATLPNPSRYFGLLPNSLLVGTFTALTMEQAADSLFSPFTEYNASSPWFTQYWSMLDYYSKKFGEQLYKKNDTYWHIAHKNILVHPKGPDKGKMRGRCAVGSTLVSTNKGLIRLDDREKILGAVTYKGKNRRTIIDQIRQPFKKEVLKVTLENGLEICASPDHRVLTLIEKGEKWVEQKDLLGSYVFCQLGGEFPKELVFNHSIETHKPVYVKIAEYISTGISFTLYDLVDKFGIHKNTIWGDTIRPMDKAGVLDCIRSRDAFGHSLPNSYKVNKKFDLKEWGVPKKGRINSNRNKITIPTKMTPELGRLIGYLIADGDLSFCNGRFLYCTTSKDKKKDFTQLFKKIFGCEGKSWQENTGYGPNKNRPCYYYEFSYKSIIDFLQYLGLKRGLTAHTKSLPWSILEAPRNCAVECISAMISSDGGIVSHSGMTGVYYSSVSKKLGKHVQLMLMRLGYDCIRRAGFVKISRPASINFLENDYTGLDKRDWKKDITIKPADKASTYKHYRIPYTDSYTLSSVNKKCGIVVDSIVKKYEDADILFSKVVKIKSLGKKTVYDLSVDAEDSLFPANNVLIHNTRFMYALDEPGWFSGDEASIKMSADEVDKALRRSMATLRTAAHYKFEEEKDFRVPWGMGFLISSPSHANDKIMRAVREAATDKTKLAIHLATWETHPKMTKESLASEFMTDPVGAMRDYGACPPLAASPFISDEKSVKACFSGQVMSNVAHVKMASSETNGEKAIHAIAKCVRTDKTTPFILSIDAGFCLSGDSLIPTENGILQIKDMGDGTTKDINIKVGSSSKPRHAKTWHFSGMKDTFKVRTESGHRIKATDVHELRVLRDGQLKWIKVKDLKLGDLLCINPNQITRKEALPLNLPEPILKSSAKALKIPEYMTEDLAYLLGFIVSEGSISKYNIRISNSEMKVINRLKDIYKKIFDCHTLVRRALKKGTKVIIQGTKTQANKDCYEIIVSSKVLCDWLLFLGLRNSEKHGIKSSYHKCIPWAILQADENSQKAFMAAYIEGDGQIIDGRHELVVWSKSNKLLHQFQILLGSHGILANIRKDCLFTSSSHDAINLYKLISPYLIFKRNGFHEKKEKVSNKFGFSIEYLHEFLRTRMIRFNKFGSHYYDDDNKKIIIPRCYNSPRNFFCYDNYDKGKYDEFLIKVSKISKVEYEKLVRLIKLRYRYSPIKSISAAKKEKVYDLSVEKSHAFIANGLVVHNCNNSFGIMLSHWDFVEKKVVSDILVEVEPHDGMVINYTLLHENVLVPICENFNVKVIVADRWNSIKILQDLNNKFKIPYEFYTLVYDDFVQFRKAIFESAFTFPRPELPIESLLNSSVPFEVLVREKPCLHLALQILTVQELGRKVIKGDGLEDDLFRCLVLAHTFIHDEKDPYKLKVGGNATSTAKGFLAKAYQRGGSGGKGGANSTSVVRSKGRSG